MIEKVTGLPPEVFGESGIKLSEVNVGIAELVNLFENWGMDVNDWLLIDEYAMWLQGILIEGPEIDGREFDAFVNVEKLPWKPIELDTFGERIMAKHVYPPLKTKIGQRYINFIEKANFGIKVRLGTKEETQLPSSPYSLPDGRMVRLITPEAMVTAFHKDTLMRQTEEDVGLGKLQEWGTKLLSFHTAFSEAGNRELATKVEVMHMEAIAKHPMLWYSQIEPIFSGSRTLFDSQTRF